VLRLKAVVGPKSKLFERRKSFMKAARKKMGIESVGTFDENGKQITLDDYVTWLMEYCQEDTEC
jgi:hypothetical protein